MAETEYTETCEEETDNTKLNAEQAQQDNPFYKMVLKECEAGIFAVTKVLRASLEEGNVADTCKASESLARIKQNAILTAASAEATFLQSALSVKGKFTEAQIDKMAGNLHRKKA